MANRRFSHGVGRAVAPVLLSIVLISAAGCSNEKAQPVGFDEVILLDVQGLFGGQDLWISADGKAFCRLVNPPAVGETDLQEARYEFTVPVERLDALRRAIAQHDFFAIRTSDRFGVPDEARPTVFVRSGEKACAVSKWANDKHRDFDPIYEFLLEIARSGKEGTRIGSGPLDREWQPEGFTSSEVVRGYLKK